MSCWESLNIFKHLIKVIQDSLITDKIPNEHYTLFVEFLLSIFQNCKVV